MDLVTHLNNSRRVYVHLPKGITILLGIIIIICGCMFNSISAASDWISLRDAKNSVDIAQFYMSKEHISWPHLISVEAAKKMPLKECQLQEDARMVIANVFRIMNRELDANNKLKKDELCKLVTLASIISQTMANSGGYINYLYADSINRLMMSQICYYMVANPDDFSTASNLLQKVPISFPIKAIVNMIGEEEENIKIKDREILLNIQPSIILVTIFTLHNKDFENFLRHLSPKFYNNSTLLKHLDIPALCYRLAETRRFAGINMGGMIEFRRRKGLNVALNLGDVSKFDNIMRGCRDKFKDELTGTRRLRVSDLLMIIENFDDPQKHKNPLLYAVE